VKIICRREQVSSEIFGVVVVVNAYGFLLRTSRKTCRPTIAMSSEQAQL